MTSLEPDWVRYVVDQPGEGEGEGGRRLGVEYEDSWAALGYNGEVCFHSIKT